MAVCPAVAALSCSGLSDLQLLPLPSRGRLGGVKTTLQWRRVPPLMLRGGAAHFLAGPQTSVECPHSRGKGPLKGLSLSHYTTHKVGHTQFAPFPSNTDHIFPPSFLAL